MVILNQVVILGKISKIGQVKELSKSKRTVNIVLHVPRNSKTYEKDILTVEVWNEAIDELLTVPIGALLGIKGRLACSSENDNISIIANSISYLSKNEE